MTEEELDGIVAQVIGIDPGKATGIAMVDLVYSPKRPPQHYALLRNFAIRHPVTRTVQLGEHSRVFRMLLQDHVDVGVPLVVLCEKYLVTRLTQQTQDTQAITVTGAMKSVLDVLEYAHTWDDSQQPSAAKMMVPDRLITGLGFSLRGVDGHSRDAMRHAIAWCINYVHNKRQLPVPEVPL